jgi:hypothetical protein
MKHTGQRLAFLLLIVLVEFAILLFLTYRQNLSQHPSWQPVATSVHPATAIHHIALPITHILGGFSIDDAGSAIRAAADGIQVDFQYGDPPPVDSNLGKQLQALHMKVIDGYISDTLFYYECHRTKTVKPPPHQVDSWCKKDSHPALGDEQTLLETIATHLQQMKSNSLIIGYWVLDDWPYWDTGSAQHLLVEIHQLIQQYTPGRAAICGFGGTIWLNKSYGWQDQLADNFTAEGCDSVGLYVYASTSANSKPAPATDTLNWSMDGMLPTMLASLQRRGWDIQKEPLIGIAQAFGGAIAGADSYRLAPDAATIERQSRSYCQHGASGLTFYGWKDSSFAPTTQTPLNSSEIETGIRNGIAACKQYWK